MLKNMADRLQVVVIETQQSPQTISGCDNCTSNGEFKLPILLNIILLTPAFISILLTLCLVASAVNILIHTGFIFECLLFLFFVCFVCVLSSIVVTVLVFFIETYFVTKTVKTVYFVFALKTSVDYFLCSSLILLCWLLIIKPDITIFVIRFVTGTLATFVIATVIWIFKIVVLRVLDIPFHKKHFFQGMQDYIFHEYVLQTLLGPSWGSDDSNKSTLRAQLKWIEGAYDSILLLVSRRLHTICGALVNSRFDNDHQVENVISMLFRNLTNSEIRDIQETDLLCVMKKEDLTNVFHLFEGTTGTKSITEESLRKWMVKVFNDRKDLVHLLNTTSNVIEHLNKLVFWNVPFLLVLLWSLLMGFGTTNFLLYISSNLLVLAIIFGDHCKMISEGIMLAIVMHPFDKGDHCIIDGEQLVVEKIGLQSTVFLKDNNEKKIITNSVLLTKSISNLNRSSNLRDTLEILVSSSTSPETIAALKLKIDEFLQSKPESWWADYCFHLEGLGEETHKYNLQITHATSFQNYKEKGNQRSELISAMNVLLKEQNIKNITIQ